MYIDLSKLPSFLRRSDAQLASIADQISGCIRNYFSGDKQFSGRGFKVYKKAVIGLSGGLDSAVSFNRTVAALGPKNVIAVRMPYGNYNDKSMEIAAEIVRAHGLPEENLLTVDITESVNLAWKNLGERFEPANEKERKLRIGNFAARERMKVLMDLGSHFDALVVGTENRTEAMTGYFTIGGDAISNLEPIQSLWKVEVFQLAKFLGLPDSVLNRAPSAELWEGQTDEDDLGEFVVTDAILASVETFRMSESHDEMSKALGIPVGVIDKVYDRITRMYGKCNAPGRIDVHWLLNQ